MASLREMRLLKTGDRCCSKCLVFIVVALRGRWHIYTYTCVSGPCYARQPPSFNSTAPYGRVAPGTDSPTAFVQAPTYDTAGESVPGAVRP